MKPFVNVGDRVRYINIRSGSRYRRGDWPEGVWLGQEIVEGTVTEYHPELPTVIIRGERLKGINAWAVVVWDNGASIAIETKYEGQDWERVR